MTASAPLFDASALGLTRVVVPTSAGDVVVRAGRRDGGRALLLLHGAAGAWTTWVPLIEASDRARRPLTDVVAIDLPGWGDTGGRVPSIEVVTAAIAETAEALGYDSWDVVGHSLGGIIALDLAARRPEQTRTVTLVSPSGVGVLDAVRHTLRGGARLPAFGGMLAVMRTLAAVGPVGTALIRAAGASGALPALSAPLFARPAAVDTRIVEALATEIRPSSFARAAVLARSYDIESWASIRCPVRSVRGTHDVFAGPADADALIARIADVRENTTASAGHFAHVEDPLSVLGAIADARTVVAETDAAAERLRRVAAYVQGRARVPRARVAA